MKICKLKSIPLQNIKITDSLFGKYSDLVAKKIIPYQWEMLNDRIEGATPTYCIKNFRVAAGDIKGERKGVIFEDTDLYKWIEAVAYCVENGCGEEFIGIVDEVVELIGRAQQDDGYLNTYYTIVAPDKRWTNLVEGHELYTAGHFIEAAVAYYMSTGKNKILSIAQKNADLICSVFGKEEGQIHGYPGHQEIELALIKLYRVTGENRYLETAKYFIEERGKSLNYFLEEIKKRGGYEHFHEFTNYDLSYSQAHLPPIEQRTAEGHAVRAMYMYSAMADLSLEYENLRMLEACNALWRNVTEKRMYITGGIGSSGFLERFTTDYDLPNNSGYAETCASIGLMMFGQRMTLITGEASYYNVVERALYNTVLSGMNITGDKYFYVNPLEVVPQFCTNHTYMQHVKSVRQGWFGVACCPPNLARTLASIGQYIYAECEDELYINLFISSSVKFQTKYANIFVELNSTLVQNGKVSIKVSGSKSAIASIKIRIPEYAGNLEIKLNGKKVDLQVEKGYAVFTQDWSQEGTIDIDFDVNSVWVAANSNVREDQGKVALIKGPCVYCMEETDNGSNLAEIYVSPDVELKESKPIEGMPGDLPTIEYTGVRISNKNSNLYGEPLFTKDPVQLKSIPYFLWNNRGEGEMLVWHKALL